MCTYVYIDSMIKVLFTNQWIKSTFVMLYYIINQLFFISLIVQQNFTQAQSLKAIQSDFKIKWTLFCLHFIHPML